MLRAVRSEWITVLKHAAHRAFRQRWKEWVKRVISLCQSALQAGDCGGCGTRVTCEWSCLLVFWCFGVWCSYIGVWVSVFGLYSCKLLDVFLSILCVLFIN